MNRKLFIVLVGVAAVLPLLAARAESGSLSGTVRNTATNQGVAGANVTVKFSGTGITVVTGADGGYVFSSIPAGQGFKLKVTKADYVEWVGACPEIKGGKRANKDIALAPEGGGTTVSGAGGGVDGTVSGVVKSGGGQPLAGVTITVGPKTTTTSSDGSYSLSVPAGEHPFAARKDGFKKAEGTVTVTAGATTSRNVELKRKD